MKKVNTSQKITTQSKPEYKNYNYLGSTRQTDLSAQPARSYKIQDDERISSQKPHSKLGAIFAFTALAIAFIAIIMIIYWTIIPIDVLKINDGKDMEAAPSTEKLDGQYYIALRIKFCKLTSSEGVVERYLVSDTQEIKLPTYKDSLGPQCGNVVTPTPMPDYAPDGIYVIRYKVTYRVNPVKTLVEEFKTEKFIHKQ